MMVKFFTTPPRPWPYLLVNANCPDLRYLKNSEEVERCLTLEGFVGRGL